MCLYFLIQQKIPQNDCEVTKPKITKLAIGVDGGFDITDKNKHEFDEINSIVILPQFAVIPLPNPELPEQVLSHFFDNICLIIKSNSYYNQFLLFCPLTRPSNWRNCRHWPALGKARNAELPSLYYCIIISRHSSVDYFEDTPTLWPNWITASKYRRRDGSVKNVIKRTICGLISRMEQYFVAVNTLMARVVIITRRSIIQKLNTH